MPVLALLTAFGQQLSCLLFHRNLKTGMRVFLSPQDRYAPNIPAAYGRSVVYKSLHSQS